MKGSDNPFPSILIEDTMAPAPPDLGGWYRLFVQGGQIKLVDSTGTVVNPNDFLQEMVSDVADDVAALEVTVSGKADYSHTQPSSSITDFTEAVQDVLGSTLVGSGVTVSYDDTGNTVTITGLSSTDTEAVRDAIGVALVGVGQISVTVDDAGDTITIATTAHQRANHTGTQTSSTISDLAEAVQDIVGAMITDTATVTKSYDDTAGTLSLTAVGGGGGGGGSGTGLWRGPWTSYTVVKAYDFSSGISSDFVNPNGWITSAKPTGYSGPVPADTQVLDSQYTQASSWPSGRDITLTIPAGVTLMKLTAAFKNGSPTAFSKFRIVKNSVVIFDDLNPASTWKAYSLPVAPGDVVILRAFDISNFNTQVVIGDVSLQTITAPYMIGHTVTYANRIWRSLVDNNAATPGGAGWAEEVLVDQKVFTYGDGRAVLTTSGGTMKLPNNTGRTLSIKSVRLDVSTAPTGAALICDVHKNGTTIFTTQANRPQVAAAALTGTTSTIDVPSWAAGETLTVDIDQVGSTVAGGILTVSILAEG